jgi:hypothetical protein
VLGPVAAARVRRLGSPAAVAPDGAGRPADAARRGGDRPLGRRLGAAPHRRGVSAGTRAHAPREEWGPRKRHATRLTPLPLVAGALDRRRRLAAMERARARDGGAALQRVRAAGGGPPDTRAPRPRWRWPRGHVHRQARPRHAGTRHARRSTPLTRPAPSSRAASRQRRATRSP